MRSASRVWGLAAKDSTTKVIAAIVRIGATKRPPVLSCRAFIFIRIEWKKDSPKQFGHPYWQDMLRIDASIAPMSRRCRSRARGAFGRAARVKGRGLAWRLYAEQDFRAASPRKANSSN